MQRLTIHSHIVLLGGILTLRTILRSVFYLTKSFFKKQPNLPNIYGHNTFALITGAAQGIGKAFSLDLAQKGFNLILLDKNREELLKTKQELNAYNIQVITIEVDFSQQFSHEFYRELVEQNNLFNLDISILINNVGIGNGLFGRFDKIKPINMLQGLLVNVFPGIYLTKLLLKQLKERNKKSLIVCISSNLSLDYIGYSTLYGCSKRMLNSYFDGIRLEQYSGQNKVDVLTLTPAMVQTNFVMNKYDYQTIQPKDVVEATWKEVRQQIKYLIEIDEGQSIGHLKHKLIYKLYSFLGDKLKVLYMQRRMKQFGESVYPESE